MFDIFAIKVGRENYKFQIISYYDDKKTAGIITFQYSGNNGVIKKQTVDAKACGNPYTMPDYEACLKDPNRNIYTYFRFIDQKRWMMSDQDSLSDFSWDMAFKGTEIKLNSGVTGPGSVSGALVHCFTNLFFDENGYPVLAKLQKKDNHVNASSSFSSIRMDGNYTYYLPEGIDRVIHESLWFEEVDGVRVSLNKNWWVVRTHDLKFMKTNISSISDIGVDAEKESVVSVSYGLNQSDLKLADFKFSTKNKVLSQCLNMTLNEVFVCKKDRADWDLKLTVVNVMKEGKWSREWRFFVNSGALGPEL